MREKVGISTRVRELCDEPTRCVRSDLEGRGVRREFALPVAQRLGAIASDLTPREYDAVLDGVAAAYGVHRSASATVSEEVADMQEMQRLMTGFTGELRKLEEGLQILSAYVARMGATNTQEVPGTLH